MVANNFGERENQKTQFIVKYAVRIPGTKQPLLSSQVTPRRRWLEVRTARRPQRTGVMLVGWGGNNGTTLTAALLANRAGLRWETKEGERRADWLGSLTQCATLRVGSDDDGKDVWAPMSGVVPLLHPDDLEVDGWDVSSLDLAAAARRNRVLDVEVQRALAPQLRELRPRAAAFDCSFVAANQQERADNVLPGTRAQQVQRLREDIRDFKKAKSLERVVVLWTANTERFAEVRPGLNDTADNLLASIERNETEVSSSTLYAVAAILEGCTYINGSPQNTLVPGCLELAERHGTHVVGDDLKTGQTKLKSVLVDFLVSAGIKPTSIVSYNHLGNNDGKNLSAPHTFRSKELRISRVCSSAGVPDNKEERGGRHGGLQPHPVRARRAPGPRGRHQVRAVRGRQQARHGRVHGRAHVRRPSDLRRAQHVRGLAARRPPAPRPRRPGRVLHPGGLPPRRRRRVRPLPLGARPAELPRQGPHGAQGDRGQLAVPPTSLHRERAEGVRRPRPGEQHAARAQACQPHRVIAPPPPPLPLHPPLPPAGGTASYQPLKQNDSRISEHLSPAGGNISVRHFTQK
ncbi:hypothetical protein FOCC_FOCC013285 [Frankliniella occidentalis]|nr:hypothetical protein FOCC_FOCC013285 [Frankliniella occidentalis]